MPALSRGQENEPSIINWFITVNGTLTDAFQVEYRIFDITAGLPGTQIFPTTPGDYEAVETGPGNFSTGSYYAYDNTEDQGWTPSMTEAIGTHRIEWRWKITSKAPCKDGMEDFEVLVESAGSTADTYITVQDVHDAGLPDEAAGGPSDEDVLASIIMWQAFIDRACRQWFKPKTMVLTVDGNEAATLFFGVPIIHIDYVKLNGADGALDTSNYRVYNGNPYPDHRANPHIKLVQGQRDIFSGNYGRPLFRKGEQNQEIKGMFGYVEPDGSVPQLIQRAHVKLVIEKLTTPIYNDGSGTGLPPPPPIVGAILEETTDAHKIKYADTSGGSTSRANSLSGITQDQEILDIIKLYKAPIGVASPTARGYF